MFMDKSGVFVESVFLTYLLVKDEHVSCMKYGENHDGSMYSLMWLKLWSYVGDDIVWILMKEWSVYC